MLKAAGLIVFAGMCAQGATYYVDSQHGRDANPGTSPERAWQTLEAVNKAMLRTGDQVRFRAGSVWRGTLAPQGFGAAGKPVVLTVFGAGARPRIEGVEEDAVRLRNFPHVVLEGLEIMNRGDGNRPKRGVHIVASNAGTVEGVAL